MDDEINRRDGAADCFNIDGHVEYVNANDRIDAADRYAYRDR